MCNELPIHVLLFILYKTKTAPTALTYDTYLYVYLCVVLPFCPARHTFSCFATVRAPVLCIRASALSPIVYLRFSINISHHQSSVHVSLLIEPSSCGTTTVSSRCLLAGYTTYSRDIRFGSVYHSVHTVLMLAPSYQSRSSAEMF